MRDDRDYKLDISSLPVNGTGNETREARPFLMVLFKCCGVYQRIYRDNDGEGYSGRCPKCAKAVRFQVGEGGTDSRAFVVE